jgi:DNA-binding transcriptional LysR family regulator
VEWHQLEYFREVARQQHFTQAAKQLAISQPALSRSIARLEHELGVPLFDRTGRAIRLNRYGKAFLNRVDRAFGEVAEGQRELADMVGPVRGTVAIGFIHILGTQLLPIILRGFRARYPAVDFKLFQGSTAALLEQLTAGDTDLCLMATHPDRPDLEWERLFEEEIFAVVPPDHRLAGRESVRLAELAAEPFVTFKPGWGLRQLNEELCLQAGFRPQVTFEGEEVATVHGLVAAGLGVALIPRSPAPREARASWLHVTEPRCERTIGIAWIRDRYESAITTQFRGFVVESFRKPGRRLRIGLGLERVDATRRSSRGGGQAGSARLRAPASPHLPPPRP